MILIKHFNSTKDMSRVLTFSRHFPAYHPKAGQPTHFVEKLWNSIYGNEGLPDVMHLLKSLNINSEVKALDMRHMFEHQIYHSPKHHTIRAGHRWSVGDSFSPRIWSDKPYSSKQITIAPPIKITAIYDIEMFMIPGDYHSNIFINTPDQLRVCFGTWNFERGTAGLDVPLRNTIALNDGLLPIDFANWFHLSPKLQKVDFGIFHRRFEGQIIVYNKDINY